MTHELKTIQPYFDDMKYGRKHFELRKNDRDFKKNDSLILQEYINGNYTGKIMYCKIVYILKNCEKFGLKKGFVILGIE